MLLRKKSMAEMKDRWMGRHTMPTIVLDAKTYKDRQKLGMPNPFMDQQIIIAPCTLLPVVSAR